MYCAGAGRTTQGRVGAATVDRALLMVSELSLPTKRPFSPPLPPKKFKHLVRHRATPPVHRRGPRGGWAHYARRVGAATLDRALLMVSGPTLHAPASSSLPCARFPALLEGPPKIRRRG